MCTATASLVVFKTARIASMFVTFDHVFKTLHELLHDVDMTHYVELKLLRNSNLKRFPHNNSYDQSNSFDFCKAICAMVINNWMMPIGREFLHSHGK